MKSTTYDNVSTYSFDILDKHPEVVNITSTRKGGVSTGDFSSLNIAFHVGDSAKLVLENRKRLADAISIDSKSLTCGEQVHGSQVAVVTIETAGRGSTLQRDALESTDSLVTNAVGVPLMIQTADCAAVSFYDSRNNAIGIAHAGKKGATDGIVPETISMMRDTYSTSAKNLLVGIGPCIYPCCYDIDLPGIIREQLLEAGVKSVNIEESGVCTSCHNDIFYSYRADGKKTGRFANIVMLQK